MAFSALGGLHWAFGKGLAAGAKTKMRALGMYSAHVSGVYATSFLYGTTSSFFDQLAQLENIYGGVQDSSDTLEAWEVSSGKGLRFATFIGGVFASVAVGSRGLLALARTTGNPNAKFFPRIARFVFGTSKKETIHKAESLADISTALGTKGQAGASDSLLRDSLGVSTAGVSTAGVSTAKTLGYRAIAATVIYFTVNPAYKAYYKFVEDEEVEDLPQVSRILFAGLLSGAFSSRINPLSGAAAKLGSKGMDIRYGSRVINKATGQAEQKLIQSMELAIPVKLAEDAFAFASAGVLYEGVLDMVGGVTRLLGDQRREVSMSELKGKYIQTYAGGLMQGVQMAALSNGMQPAVRAQC